MATPAKRLNPTDLKAIFGLEPANAIAYLKRKGYAITWHWQDMLDQAHDQAFTVAKAMRLDLLSDIRAALETALQQGQTLKQFTANLQPILQAQGWWGKQVIVDSQGTGEFVQLGSPRRLKTIYQTNLQSAYMAGRKASMEATAETHPYWMYIAILDGKTRPSHRAMHGQIFRHDDPIWSSIFPPNGFNCRCRVIALSEAAVKRRGLTVVSSEGRMFVETVETGTDKRTGEIRQPRSPAFASQTPKATPPHSAPIQASTTPRHRPSRGPKTQADKLAKLKGSSSQHITCGEGACPRWAAQRPQKLSHTHSL